MFFFGDPCANRDYVSGPRTDQLCGMGEGFVECGIT
jgi:hypothetical protein